MIDQNSIQLSKKVLMVRPSNFGFNEETFLTNSFQNRSSESPENIQENAVREFDGFVYELRSHGVIVEVFEDVTNSETPDSIFPNNWFSTHRDGRLCLYPMAVENRRKERRTDIIEELRVHYSDLVDFSTFENEENPLYLEGTGSLIFDHDNKVVYAAISPRTSKTLVDELAIKLDYTPVTFKAFGKDGELIYHTNVMMTVGDRFIAIGMNTIDIDDREHVQNALNQSNKEIILLENNQVYNHFAGNILQLKNNSNESILALSKQAYDSLSRNQRQSFGKYVDHFVKAQIPTIETIGGGSARCMLAELY